MKPRNKVLTMIERAGDLQKTLSRKAMETAWWEMTEERQAEHFGAMEELSNLDTEIVDNIAVLFDDYHMKDLIPQLLRVGQDIYISTVERDPETVVCDHYRNYLQRLLDIDQRIMSSKLHYLWHIETDHYSDGGACFQIYLAEEDLAHEWYNKWDEVYEQESEYRRYIPYELFFVADFLHKYRHDTRLINLWSGPFWGGVFRGGV